LLRLPIAPRCGKSLVRNNIQLMKLQEMKLSDTQIIPVVREFVWLGLNDGVKTAREACY